VETKRESRLLTPVASIASKRRFIATREWRSAAPLDGHGTVRYGTARHPYVVRPVQRRNDTVSNESGQRGGGGGGEGGEGENGRWRLSSCGDARGPAQRRVTFTSGAE